MTCNDQRRLKGKHLKSDPGDKIQDSRPHVKVFEIRGDDEGRAHMIGIPVAVFIGKEALPSPKAKEVILA